MKWFSAILMVITVLVRSAGAQEITDVDRVPTQPLLAQTHRLIEAMEFIGSPLDTATTRAINALKTETDQTQVTAQLQQLLDPYCLAVVNVPPMGPPDVTIGAAKLELQEQGWRTFLVKIVNPTGRTGRLVIESPNARPLPHSPAEEVASRWMQMSAYEGQPMRPDLGGLALEYRIVQIYSHGSGRKEALLEFTVSGNAGPATELIRRWRFDQGTDGWQAMNQCKIHPQDGVLRFESTGEDPFMGAEVTARGGPLTLRFWAQSEEAGIGQLFWWTQERPQATADRQRNFLTDAGKPQMYEVTFPVDGTLAGIRLDPLIRPGKMQIDWIELYSARNSKNWAQLPVRFESLPATPVTLRVLDAQGQPAFARFEIRDSSGRVYPTQSKRLAPDFFFQPHIYRGDGETISLPAGAYQVVCSRGPETIPEIQELTVTNQPTELVYQVRRWVDPAERGWWSGDHHIHAAGCLHYENPTQGVQPADMIRHIMGEDLKVGCCLTWGPCFDYQKRFFTGEVAEHSQYPYTLRYDVEVSGFGSHMSGHLNLLNLKQQIYPGGESKDHWPTLGLNTLRWAKRQGAICGPAHSSIGLERTIGRLPETEGKDGAHGLPNYNIPAFDGIGANEFIVDVTHQVPGPTGKPVQAVDFISAMNTDRVAEWNMWYHVLNSGFRVAVSGETDFPCVSGERVGIGRVYAKVDGELTFEKWVESIANGRSYVSDGTCHLLDFSAVNPTSGHQSPVGVGGSQVSVSSDTLLTFQVNTAARLEGSSQYRVELIVNGYPVKSQSVAADGEMRELSFPIVLEESGWVAVRVFPHAHTNPLYVTVNDQPFGGLQDSLRWCLAGVEQCWRSKQPTYAVAEQGDARDAYEHARQVFRNRLKQVSQ